MECVLKLGEGLDDEEHEFMRIYVYNWYCKMLRVVDFYRVPNKDVSSLFKLVEVVEKLFREKLCIAVGELKFAIR